MEHEIRRLGIDTNGAQVERIAGYRYPMTEVSIPVGFWTNRLLGIDTHDWGIDTYGSVREFQTRNRLWFADGCNSNWRVMTLTQGYLLRGVS